MRLTYELASIGLVNPKDMDPILQLSIQADSIPTTRRPTPILQIDPTALDSDGPAMVADILSRGLRK